MISAGVTMPSSRRRRMIDEAVDAGDHAIDGHHGVLAAAGERETVVAVDGEIDAVAAGRERLDELIGRLRIVLDDENAAPSVGHDFHSPRASSLAPGIIRKLTYSSGTDAFVI